MKTECLMDDDKLWEIPKSNVSACGSTLKINVLASIWSGKSFIARNFWIAGNSVVVMWLSTKAIASSHPIQLPAVSWVMRAGLTQPAWEMVCQRLPLVLNASILAGLSINSGMMQLRLKSEISVRPWTVTGPAASTAFTARSGKTIPKREKRSASTPANVSSKMVVSQCPTCEVVLAIKARPKGTLETT